MLLMIVVVQRVVLVPYKDLHRRRTSLCCTHRMGLRVIKHYRTGTDVVFNVTETSHVAPGRTTIEKIIIIIKYNDNNNNNEKRERNILLVFGTSTVQVEPTLPLTIDTLVSVITPCRNSNHPKVVVVVVVVVARIRRRRTCQRKRRDPKGKRHGTRPN